MNQPIQQHKPPGTETAMNPAADHGERSYKGTGRLAGKAAVITGGDSGIGRAVAIAFAREGADVLISYLNEEEDAGETARWVEEAGRKAVLVSGDIAQPAVRRPGAVCCDGPAASRSAWRALRIGSGTLALLSRSQPLHRRRPSPSRRRLSGACISSSSPRSSTASTRCQLGVWGPAGRSAWRMRLS